MILLSGCEGHESNVVEPEPEPEVVLDPILLDDIGIVKLINDPIDTSVVSREILTVGNKLIQILPSTEIMAMRGSNSGFSPGGIYDIKIGSTVWYYYYMKNVDFLTEPDVYRVEKIYIYNSDYDDLPLPTE